MEYRTSSRASSRCVSLTTLQTEQREELKGLLKKYGNDWEPWRSELKKYKGEGKELLQS